MPDIGQVKFGLFRLYLDPYRLFEPHALECFVPFQNTGCDGGTVFFWNIFIDPENNGLFRFR